MPDFLDKIEFKPVWEQISDADSIEVRNLWVKEGALTNAEQIAVRLREVAILVKHKENGILGLSTVRTLTLDKFNKNKFYEYRCFISSAYRAPALDTKLLVETKRYFERHNKANAVGLIMVIENEMIKQNWTKAVWPGADMVFAGYTSEGHHIRISYFKKVKI